MSKQKIALFFVVVVLVAVSAVTVSAYAHQEDFDPDCHGESLEPIASNAGGPGLKVIAVATTSCVTSKNYIKTIAVLSEWDGFWDPIAAEDVTLTYVDFNSVLTTAGSCINNNYRTNGYHENYNGSDIEWVNTSEINWVTAC